MEELLSIQKLNIWTTKRGSKKRKRKDDMDCHINAGVSQLKIY